jgi:hypothetical protein
MLEQQPDARLIVHPSIQTYTDQDLHPQIHTYGDHELGQPCFGVSRAASEDLKVAFEVASSNHKFLWYDLEKSYRTGLPLTGERISM